MGPGQGLAQGLVGRGGLAGMMGVSLGGGGGGNLGMSAQGQSQGQSQGQ